MGDVMRIAAFSLAEAKFSMSGDFTNVVIQSVSKAQIKIRTKRDNVAGNFSLTSSSPFSLVFQVLFYLHLNPSTMEEIVSSNEENQNESFDGNL